MIPLTCSTQNVLSTAITTFTIEPCKINENTTEHLLYIANVSKEKNEITVRPINPLNNECVSEFTKIVNGARLVLVSQTAKKLYLHVLKAALDLLPLKSCKLKLEFENNIVELGNISSYSLLENDNYKLNVKIFNSFITVMKQRQQKNDENHQLENSAICVK